MSGFRFKGPESSSDVSGSSLDVRVEVVRCQSFLSAEGTEGLALTSGSRICSPGINCSDLRLVGVIRYFLFSITVLFHLYLHSYLLFQLFLLFHSAQRPLQEVDDCRLVFCRVLPQMLHMCWPGKPGGTLWSRIREISFRHLVAENLAPSLLRFSSTSLSRYFWGR